MADNPEHPLTRAAFDAHAMHAFLESLEQSRKALRDTDHIVMPSRAKLVYPDQQEESPQEPREDS